MDGRAVAMWVYKIFLLILLTSIAACGEQNMPSPYHAVDVTWQIANANFHLVDHNGKSRSLEDFNGKVVVLFFGYTHCPEVCPTTLADLAQVMRQLGKNAERVQVLFITLDPEHDTPELLAKYITYFDSGFLGLRGDAQATAQAAKAFGVNFSKHFDNNGDYTLDHSDGTYLIGRNGRPMLRSPYGQRIELLTNDVKILLAIGG
jgi:protein SCO1/2